MNQTKIDTLFKAQTKKMTPYAREKQKLKIAWTGQPRNYHGTAMEKHNLDKIALLIL